MPLMDIQKITSELRATGLTQQALANLVPCSQATINAYENGNRARRYAFSIASRLIELHAELCAPVASEAGHQTPAPRRATDPAPAPGHAGRQPPTTNAIFDTVPDRAAIGIDARAIP